MEAIILARVSTKEQEEGHSIAAQRQRLVDYCARKGLELIKTYELVESSTRGERKEFAAMLEFAQAQNETVAIVADAVDRFQRSFKESVLIDELRRKGTVELHFCRESMVINKDASSSDILRWDFSVMGAKSYVLNLSENVRRSLDYKRRNGEWGGKAPLGYLNHRDADNKSTLIPDPERAFLIRMLFEEYAKGSVSISGDLVRMAREWGLRNKTRKGGVLSASQIQHILMNPFYYGEMRIKGKLYPHSYQPLISKELFDQCEAIRLGSSRATAVRYSEKPFVFRGITQHEYDKKARELKERQAEIAARIEQHQHGDSEYRTTLESLISLASRAAELFERSKTEQKRQLIAFVFSNLRLRGKKLEFSLRSPFDLMVDRRSYSSWLAFLNTVRTERCLCAHRLCDPYADRSLGPSLSN